MKNYYKVLSLKPDDKNATEMIEKITKEKTQLNPIYLFW